MKDESCVVCTLAVVFTCSHWKKPSEDSGLYTYSRPASNAFLPTPPPFIPFAPPFTFPPALCLPSVSRILGSQEG
eukprot:scaffold317330_cov32-Tisochrysis_lutea.AAC.1